MASPNYQGEKRRRDLAKQAKKKEKLARKLEKRRGDNASPAAQAERTETPPKQD